jgi:hypothetical protein
MQAGHQITVTVVVSGAPFTLTANPNQKVEHLIEEALKAAGIPHPKREEWTLRFSDGGAAIDPDSKIAGAGIATGATLFLDPAEGGGGQLAVLGEPAAGPEPEPPPELVDPAVSAAKLAGQLADWQANEEVYRERGWILLGSGELHVDVGFSARLPLGPLSDVPAIPLAVRIGFENYDVWAPSVRVIDPISRRWLEVPRLRAPDFGAAGEGEAPLDFFVNGHPETGRVFLCTPGVREYHSHPEHSGDDWLLYRGRGFGTLGQLCDLLWRLTARTVTGLNFAAGRFPLDQGAATNFAVEIRQEDVDQIAPQLQAQIPQQIAPDQLPQELRAQLPPEVQALLHSSEQ